MRGPKRLQKSLLYNQVWKKASKAPKIQRLVTPLTLQRKIARIADKKKRVAKSKADAAEYQKLLASRLKEQRECRSESLAKKSYKFLCYDISLRHQRVLHLVQAIPNGIKQLCQLSFGIFCLEFEVSRTLKLPNGVRFQGSAIGFRLDDSDALSL
ncbi:hypothetical protein CsatA_004517 [Cannabis sativa]